VGKTHVSAALVGRLRSLGREVAALKPVETGVAEGEVGADAARLAQSSGFHVKHPCYAFEPPISPHLAARRIGCRIELSEVSRWVAAHRAPYQLVETAGGLLSPLSESTTNLDLTVQLDPDALVLVAANRVGVLHDVSVCLRVLRLEHPQLVERTAVALSHTPDPDPSATSNGEELRRLGIAERVVEFPCEPVDHEDSASAARELLAHLGLE
jgi:dethiobiotin synthetase